MSPVGGSEGRRPRRGDDMVHVPSREIVRGPAAAFENGRLNTAETLPLAGALVGVQGAVYGRGPGYLRRVQPSSIGRDQAGEKGEPLQGACTHIARFGR